QPLDLGEAEAELAQTHGATPSIQPVISVDVLAEQRDLAHAGFREAAGLGEDLLDRPGDLCAARIGDDAERAELVAALLDGEEGGEAPAQRNRLGRRGKVLELVLRRKFGVD